jgi:hypothetical protein
MIGMIARKILGDLRFLRQVVREVCHQNSKILDIKLLNRQPGWTSIFMKKTFSPSFAGWRSNSVASTHDLPVCRFIHNPGFSVGSERGFGEEEFS